MIRYKSYLHQPRDNRCFRALFARKPELIFVNTLEECVACSESALESPNATFHGHILVRA